MTAETKKGTTKSDRELAEVLSKPIASSAERSKKPGNTHPVKPEDREPGLTGNTRATDDLAAALSQQKQAEDRVKQLEEQNNKLEDDALYQRDQKIYEMSKGGRLPGQNIGEASTESEEARAESDLKSLEAFDERIKKGEKLNEEETSNYTKTKERVQSRATKKK